MKIKRWQEFIEGLEIYPKEEKIEKDWLLFPGQQDKFIAKCYTNEKKDTLILSNGLVRRRFLLTPSVCTIEYKNLKTQEHIVRSPKPEAIITINGKDYYVGGANGIPEHAYFLPEWKEKIKKETRAFVLEDIHVEDIKERLKWKKKRYARYKIWPPKGKKIVFIYRCKKLQGIEIEIHYELYNDLPLISKWIVIKNKGENTRIIDRFTSELLALVEKATVSKDPSLILRDLPLYVETDYVFGIMDPDEGIPSIKLTRDPEYITQVDFDNTGLLLLISEPPLGPAYELAPNTTFETYRTYELFLDTTERERRFLSIRRMYLVLAPWITENPIFMHMISADPEKVKPVIDQCKEVGFEMVILSFGSGINMEWEDEEFYEEFRELFRYAHTKGIEIGTYSLFSSRSIGKEVDVIDPRTGEPNKHARFGKAPCLATEWGKEYLRKLRRFIEETEADFLEHDGPYPGDICASSHHTYHKSLKDSQWTQWRLQTDFYKWCREQGIYVNAPDWYFLSGTNKTGIGYKEVNWSLPKERQVIIARQNIYNGTYYKLPSMGWMFTPLTVYHKVGNWKKATLEPLSKNLAYYEMLMSQNFLSGVQSCYRGKRLYDTEQTREMVKKWVNFYKKYREILDSDIIHIKRPNGREWDGILHVNPSLPIKGFAVFYNPTKEVIKESVKFSLYYTGIKDKAYVSEKEGPYKQYTLDCMSNITLSLTIPPRNLTWFIIKEEK